MWAVGLESHLARSARLELAYDEDGVGELSEGGEKRGDFDAVQARGVPSAALRAAARAAPAAALAAALCASALALAAAAASAVSGGASTLGSSRYPCAM